MERGTNPGKSATTELDDRNGKNQKSIVFLFQVKKLGVERATQTLERGVTYPLPRANTLPGSLGSRRKEAESRGLGKFWKAHRGAIAFCSQAVQARRESLWVGDRECACVCVAV